MKIYALFSAILLIYGSISAQLASSIMFPDEILIVRAILDSNGITDVNASEIAVEENNRMVSLNLTNRRVGTDGLKKLPGDIGKLTALRELRLANNSLSNLPDEMANLTSLIFLDLGSNGMSALPPVIGQIKSLEKIDIRYNAIEVFPEVLYELPNLWYLQMWGNYQTSLPESFGKLSKLKELYLKDNRLAMLPHAIVGIKSLVYIDYNYNRICAPYPDVDTWLKKKDKEYKESQKCW